MTGTGVMDLHIHSTISDGSLTPSELVALALREGVAYLALTDHDSVAGVEQAAAAARDAGIRLLKGVELDAAYSAELHILGLRIGPDEAFTAWMNRIAERRGERNARILRKLAQNGLDISALLPERPLQTVSRTHIADALVRLGAAQNLGDAFRRYLVKGRAGYDSHPRPLPEEIIEQIKAIGGIAVLAHPGKLGKGVESVLRRLKGAGLDALESHYPTHTHAQTAELLSLCASHGLLATCGSDFHGAFRPEVRLGETWESSPQLIRTRELLFR